MEDKNKNPGNITAIIPIAIGGFLGNLDSSIVNIALPTLLKDFKVDASAVSTVTISYLLAISSFLLFFGKLSDIKGPRKIFIIGFIVFLIASILCTFSTSIFMLSSFRFIQGIGASILSATLGALILHSIPPEMRGRAFGFMAVAGGTGFAIGAPLGGLIIKYFGWKYIFYINIPLCIIALLATYRFLPEKKINPDKKSKIDIISVILSFIFLCSLNISLNKIDNEGLKSPVVLLFFIIFILTFFIFIYRQTKISSPLMDIKLFKNRGLSAGLIAGFLTGVIMSGVTFLFPFYFEFVKNLNSAETGMYLMIMPLLSTLLGPIAGYLSDKYGPRKISLCAAIIMITAIIMLSFFNNIIPSYYIIISLILLGISLAFFLTANISLIMGSAPEGKEGITSAVAGLNSALSGSIGISVFAAIFSCYVSGKEALGSTFNIYNVTKAYQTCFIYFILLSIAVFITIFFTKERGRRNETKIL